MPAYEPGPWNRPEILPLNNCYNYATNNRNQPPVGPLAPGQPPLPLPEPAEPGKKVGITCGREIDDFFQVNPDGSVRLWRIFRFTCEGIRVAVRADGLDDPNEGGDCPPDCWKIAYYVRAPDPAKRQDGTGDYHFVRQDTDGKWSHKPNRGNEPVTRKQFNPATGQYDGADITDPPEPGSNVGQGYVFCGYLCCCPNTTVALADPPPPRDDQAVAITPIDGLGKPMSQSWTVASARLDLEVRKISNRIGGEWTKGFAPDGFVYRLDVPRSSRGSSTVLVGERSLTIWDGYSAQFLVDPNGIAATRFGALLSPRLGTHPAESRAWPLVPRVERPGDTIGAVNTIMDALNAGSMTVSEARQLLLLVEAQRRALGF